MTLPQPVPPGGSTYLVERYLSAAAAAGLASSVARVARGCLERSGLGPGVPSVRYLHSIYLPAEDTCFCVFQAASAEAVRAVNAAADFALDRVSDAILMFAGEPAPPEL